MLRHQWFYHLFFFPKSFLQINERGPNLSHVFPWRTNLWESCWTHCKADAATALTTNSSPPDSPKAIHSQTTNQTHLHCAFCFSLKANQQLFRWTHDQETNSRATLCHHSPALLPAEDSCQRHPRTDLLPEWLLRCENSSLIISVNSQTQSLPVVWLPRI